MQSSACTTTTPGNPIDRDGRGFAPHDGQSARSHAAIAVPPKVTIGAVARWRAARRRVFARFVSLLIDQPSSL
jgi:hypothetical protein